MRTPPGWYDDGSGRQRWWDGQQWADRYLAPPPEPSRHLWWALSPVYSCTTVTFIPALHGAIKLRRKDLWIWAVSLMAGNALSWALIGSAPRTVDGSTSTVQTVGTWLAIALAALGTIHAFRIRAEVFGPPRPAEPTPAVHPAIAQSLAARQRRQESLALAAKDPALARDLRIGRPELTRQYDDGGLVDVNHVPTSVLVSHLGLTDDLARGVVAARESIGGFRSIDDLCSLGGLPINVLDEVRDRVLLL